MLRIALTLLILLFPAFAQAQETPQQEQQEQPQVQAQEAQEEAGDYETRLKLADRMLEISPPRDQIRTAIDRYIELRMKNNPPVEQEQFRSAMLKIINYKALEKISREAYAEIFTEKELAAMTEYYSKPEAISAGAKVALVHEKIYPAIMRMMDQALIRARTESQGHGQAQGQR